MRELHLENSGPEHNEICAALSLLTQLNKLSLINWYLSPQLPHILQSTISLYRFVLVPAYEEKVSYTLVFELNYFIMIIITLDFHS